MSERRWIFFILINGYNFGSWFGGDKGVYEIVLGREFGWKIRFLWDKEDNV